MTTLLLWDDALRSREMRHEIGEAIGDPIAFIERDGRRIVVGSVLEEAILTAREDVVDEFWSNVDLGADQLIDDRSFPEHLIGPEIARRALERTGAPSVKVPLSFPVGAADHLRSNGIEVVVDQDTWSRRRRHKTPGELEGIERAQRAAETAMLTAGRMLRDAEPTADGRLRFEGEILSAELMREAMSGELLAQGAEGEDILIHSGDACLRGHDPGRGPILPNESCIVDCFPRDRRSGAYTDMTRTFVPGAASDDIRKLHAACLEALDIAFECTKPGHSDAFERVAHRFAEQGWPTQLTQRGGGALREGFFHSLGHGVGLDVHEPPLMGRRADALIVGDVIAIEPGVYFKGIGGVRLEDTVLVTEQGPRHFSDPYPYDLEP
ncbi:MAG: M24 family metallopeptidase [Actinomycetota bacterium]